MARAARRIPTPFVAVEVADGPALRNQVEHPRCAKCGHPATLGMMLTDGTGTGPWLCHPSSFLGRAGCRRRPA